MNIKEIKKSKTKGDAGFSVAGLYLHPVSIFLFKCLFLCDFVKLVHCADNSGV